MYGAGGRADHDIGRTRLAYQQRVYDAQLEGGVECATAEGESANWSAVAPDQVRGLGLLGRVVRGMVGGGLARIADDGMVGHRWTPCEAHRARRDNALGCRRMRRRRRVSRKCGFPTGRTAPTRPRLATVPPTGAPSRVASTRHGPLGRAFDFWFQAIQV